MKSVLVTPDNYVYSAEFEWTSTIKITNRSRTNSLMIFEDGVTAGYRERMHGSNRAPRVVRPGSSLRMRYTRLVALSAQGALAGDDRYSTVDDYAAGVPVTIEEYEEALPESEQTPPETLIAAWENKALSWGVGDLISFQAFDPDFRLPQAKGLICLELKTHTLSVPTIAYLGTTGSLSDADSPHWASSEYAVGFLYMGGYAHAVRRIFIPGDQYMSFCLSPRIAGNGTFSGRLYYVNQGPVYDAYGERLQAEGYTASDLAITSLPTKGIARIEMAWARMGGANGTLSVSHRNMYGVLLNTQTFTLLSGTEGLQTITPHSSFMDIQLSLADVGTSYEITALREFNPMVMQ